MGSLNYIPFSRMGVGQQIKHPKVALAVLSLGLLQTALLTPIA
jgi:hypothetical protein